MNRGTQYHIDHQDDWQLIEKEGFNWGPPNLLGRRIVYWKYGKINVMKKYLK